MVPDETRAAILLTHARTMRHDATPAERRLWQAWRKLQLKGLKFRRQVPLGPYIADFYCFYCAELRLVIELDGISPIDGVEVDARREAWMNAHGIRVLRFTNADLLGNVEGVVTAIVEATRTPPPPSPLPQGEGEHSYTSPAVSHSHV